MQSQWLTVPRPDSGSVSVVPREMLPGSRVGGRALAAHVAGCPGTGLGVNFVGGRTHNWQTVKPFLWHFRCVCLQVYNTRCSATLCHRIPFASSLPFARELTVVTKVYTASIWTAFHYGPTCNAGPKERQMQMQILLAPYWKLRGYHPPSPLPFSLSLSQIQPSNRPQRQPFVALRCRACSKRSV